VERVSRRRFVLSSGAAVATLGAACSSGGDDDDAGGGGGAREGDGAGSNGGPGTTSEAAAFDPSDWDSVRDQFRLDPELTHFAAFVLASHPRPVAEAIQRHRDGLDADVEGYIAATEAEAEGAVRQAAADYLGTEATAVALTDSTTMGLGLVYGGLRLARGDEVLASEHDFYSTYEALRLRSARDGVVVNRVTLYDDRAEATAGDMVERLVAGLTPATRVVALTWVHSGTGVKVPVADMTSAVADRAAELGTEPPLVCLDGVHGLGAEDVDVADLGVDFLVSGTHKWLFGPRGTGIVWGRSEAWDRVDPSIPPFEPASFQGWLAREPPAGPRDGLRVSPGGYHSFEHRWALNEAFDFHRSIGRSAVQERIADQVAQLKEGLAEIDGVTVVTPPSADLSAGIVCADTGRADPAAVVQALREDGFVASVTPYGDRYVRFGPGIVTTPDDVDALVEALASL
jgi:selenocysteine lyase/cysteine desulfurase